jgi:hypothetical protein
MGLTKRSTGAREQGGFGFGFPGRARLALRYRAEPSSAFLAG